MHDESVDAALNELAIELERVQPAPEFATRIRVVIAREASPARLRPVLWLVGAAAVVAVIAATGLRLKRWSEVPERTPDVLASAARGAAPEHRGPSSATFPPRVTRQNHRVSRPPVGHEAVQTEQAAALDQLLQAIRGGHATVPLERADLGEPLPEVSPIEIPEITIEPLPVLPGSGGERREL